MVSVFPDEAVLALLEAEDVGHVIDRARLERQAAASGSVDEWRKLSHADRACVFLRNEECAVYEHRPSACRKYVVVTPPELCDTEKYDGGQVGMLASAMAEVITSAAINTWGWEPLARVLLKLLEAPCSEHKPGRS